jgi:hypothetical protein
MRFKIPTYVTLPDGNKYHWIEDKHLEVIMKISSPLSATISVACFGYILGAIKDICALKDVTVFTFAQLISVGLFSAVAVTFIVTGIYALFSKSEAKTILEEIRARKPQAWQNPNESKGST